MFGGNYGIGLGIKQAVGNGSGTLRKATDGSADQTVYHIYGAIEGMESKNKFNSYRG
jgi:hypothetical protein